MYKITDVEMLGTHTRCAGLVSIHLYQVWETVGNEEHLVLPGEASTLGEAVNGEHWNPRELF